MGILKEFMDFLAEYKIISLMVAFVMGLAANDLVKSFVSNILMPLINPLIPEGSWETATLNIGPVSLGWGPFLNSAIHFTLIAAVIFIAVKKLSARKVTIVRKLREKIQKAGRKS